MTWTRLDDRWTDRCELAGLSYEVRWHYLAMIQFCSRTGRIDGFLRLADARRCSDIEAPDEAHRVLIHAGLLEKADGGLRLIEISDHVPPPSVRQNAEKTKIRMRRHRAHQAGDHAHCLARHCDQALTVTGTVTRNPGTGQDRTGQATKEEVNSEGEAINYETGEVAQEGTAKRLREVNPDDTPFLKAG